MYLAAICRVVMRIVVIVRQQFTHREGNSLDGANGVTAIARIAGAAQYLVAIHDRATGRQIINRSLAYRINTVDYDGGSDGLYDPEGYFSINTTR